jgi:hypothetical protein
MAHTRTNPHSKASQRPRPTASSAMTIDRQRLEAFVGEWRTEGEQLDSAVGPAAAISATQTYEWLQGNAFLIHRFDGMVGTSNASCIEIIGVDRETDRCRAHTFYNNGLINVWDVEFAGDEWQLNGDWNMGGRQMKVRCKITFGDNGTTMYSRWEHSVDGRVWQAFWDLTARKTQSH